jgi:23S rRNA (cytosine1962-C5)-methyltransferase
VQPATFETVPLEHYELVDSGAGEKLERVGGVLLRRPDPQALWSCQLAEAEWARADLTFVRESDRGGRWEARADAVKAARGRDPHWHFEHAGARFVIRPTPFKHIGLFPEQAPNWQHIAQFLPRLGLERPRLLNLFGYTGVASVLAAKAGAEVTHVDASKTSVTWTRENAELSGLKPDCMRWIVDDAHIFARREVRRGARYHAILLDPPHYGRGPKGEVWQFEEHIAPLMESVRALLEPRACVILSTYAIGVSPLSLANLISELGPGEVEAGELVLAPRDSAPRDSAPRDSAPRDSAPRDSAPRGAVRHRLPAGFCARWSRL